MWRQGRGTGGRAGRPKDGASRSSQAAVDTSQAHPPPTDALNLDASQPRPAPAAAPPGRQQQARPPGSARPAAGCASSSSACPPATRTPPGPSGWWAHPAAATSGGGGAALGDGGLCFVVGPSGWWVHHAATMGGGQGAAMRAIHMGPWLWRELPPARPVTKRSNRKAQPGVEAGPAAPSRGCTRALAGRTLRGAHQDQEGGLHKDGAGQRDAHAPPAAEVAGRLVLRRWSGPGGRSRGASATAQHQPTNSLRWRTHPPAHHPPTHPQL